MQMANQVNSQNFSVILDDFIISETTEFGLGDSDVAINNSGEFVIVYEFFKKSSASYSDDFRKINAQFFRANGEPIANKVTIVSSNDLELWNSKVAMDKNGNFVVSWDESGTKSDEDISIIKFQIFDSNGIARSEQMVIGDDSLKQSSADIAMSPDGNFVVTWASYTDNSSKTDIHAQLFSPDGVAQSNAFLVSAESGIAQNDPEVAINNDGEFVVTWKAEKFGDESYVYARRYDSFGTALGGVINVNDDSSCNFYNPSIAMSNDDSFAITSECGEDILVQTFNTDGSKKINKIINLGRRGLHHPKIAMYSNQDLLITYNNKPEDESSSNIYANHYSSNGQIINEEVLINKYTLDNQISPAIAVNDDGMSIIAFNSYTYDPYFFDGGIENEHISAKLYSLESKQEPNPEQESLVIRGTHSDDNLEGGSGDDELTGLRGKDYLNGYEGNDVLRAGNGKDTIIGGAGKDEMYGGFGHNTFMDELDGEVDQITFKSDQFAYNYVYDKAGNNSNGRKLDIIKGLDSFDKIKIEGVKTNQLKFTQVNDINTPSGEMSGIGIFADGFIEGIYTGDNLSTDQIGAMTEGIPI